MPSLGSLFPNSDVQKGTWLNTGGTTTGDFFALVDETIASANDADYIRGPAGAAASGANAYDAGITNMPSDFNGMTTLNYNVRYRQFNRSNDTVGFTLLIESSTGTALTNTVTFAGVTTTTFTNSGATAFTLTSAGTNATKADWDGAVLVVAQTYTASGPNDNAYIAVSAIELTGTYLLSRTATSSATGSSVAKVPPVSFTDNFTRADSTTSVGGDWTTTVGTLGITSNAAYMVSGASGSFTFQNIQSSEFKQVVSAQITNPSPTQTIILYIAYKDSSNWVRFSYFPGFATWILTSNVSGTTTNHGNNGLSGGGGIARIVRDGDVFTASAGNARTASFTITGLDYNGVGFGISTSGTSYTVDDFNARPLVTTTRTASSSASGTSSSTRVITKLRTGSSSGTGTSSVSKVVTSIRTATSSGTGSSSTSSVISKLRTATASGVGTSSSNELRTVPRTASASATSSETATPGNYNTFTRTASSSGTGSSSTTTLVVRVRTISDTGTGSSSVIQLRSVHRTSFSSGVGSSLVVVVRTVVRTTTPTTGLGSSSVVWLLEINRTALSQAYGSSSVLSGKSTARDAYGYGYGDTIIATWKNAGVTLNESIKMPPFWVDANPKFIRRRR